jgi:hypothetical protein
MCFEELLYLLERMTLCLHVFSFICHVFHLETKNGELFFLCLCHAPFYVYGFFLCHARQNCNVSFLLCVMYFMEEAKSAYFFKKREYMGCCTWAWAKRWPVGKKHLSNLNSRTPPSLILPNSLPLPPMLPV